MSRRILSFIIALTLALAFVCVPVFADAAGTAAARSYCAGQFTDVNENAWYGLNGQGTIAAVWERGLMYGTGTSTFGVGSGLTIAQALTVADRIHCKYETGAELVSTTTGGPWYEFYVNYAIEHEIIQEYEFSDYTAGVTRAQMVHIFAHCLPEDQFKALGTVGSLPDVTINDQYGEEIFLFYRAGIIQGSDDKGTFHPDNPIKREEAASIILHIYDADTRSVMANGDKAYGNICWSDFPAETRSRCDAILSGILTDGMSDREKVVAIHDYMVNSYHYDYDVAEGRSSRYGEETHDYSCLLDHGCGVCEAYMELFSLLCDAAGVRCEMVIGGGHGWNRVWIDEGWLHVDVTYDDPVYYLNGVLTDKYSDQYLLKSMVQMSKDHRVEASGVWLTSVGE